MSDRIYRYSTVQFSDNNKKLLWAKCNLDSEIYKEIEQSYRKIIKCTLIVFLTIVIICFIVISFAFYIQDSVHSAFDEWKQGHVSGDIVWYINNEKHQINLSDYGYDSANYFDGDYFRIYFDKEGYIVKITPDKEVNKVLEDYLAVIAMIGSIIFMLFAILCIHLPIAFHTYGKMWRRFSVWYDKGSLHDGFT